MHRNEFITKHAIDAQWFLLLKEIKAPLLLRSLRVPATITADNQKKFFQNPESPEVSYAHIDTEASESAIQALEALKNRIIQEEAEKSIAQAYREKIDELILEQQILLAAVQGNGEDFCMLNEKRFGRLDASIVHDIRMRLCEKYALFAPLCIGVKTESLCHEVSQETFDKVKAQFALPSFSYIESDKIYTTEEIAVLLQEVLTKEAPGWKVDVSENVIHVCVESRRRMVHVPKGMKARGERLKRIIAHEIEVHVRRRQNGRVGTFQLLGIGLAKHLPAEEGLGIMAEQVTGSRFVAYGGHDKYLALALATGTFDGVQRDFKDTCLILQRYFYERKKKKHGHNNALRISQERAWKLTWRIFRGGDPQIPGCCFLRDKIYREGNILMWDTASRDGLPETVFAGKYDPSNEEHQALVDQFEGTAQFVDITLK